MLIKYVHFIKYHIMTIKVSGQVSLNKKRQGLYCHRWQVGLQVRWQGLLEQGAGPGLGLESDCC